MKSSEATNWKQAIQAEIIALENDYTREIVDRPTDKNVLSSRWVFVKKFESNGNVRFKARLVMRGFEQDNVISDLYAPVTKMATVRTFLSYSNVKGYHISTLSIVIMHS